MRRSPQPEGPGAGAARAVSGAARRASGADGDREVEIDGRSVRLTNLRKLMYPASAFTKGEMLDYYEQIAGVLLPHLERRPLTMKRFPDGVAGAYFFQKDCPKHRPEWLSTEPVWVERYGEHFEYCLADDRPSLLWLANLGNIEFHPALARAGDLASPTCVVFDLDPGHPATLLDAAELSLLLRAMLTELGLETVVKSSGSKGIHVAVPLNTPTTYSETKRFARAIAETLAARLPAAVVASTARRRRAGRVLVDWAQNDHHRTIVAPYSLRAKDDPAGILDAPAISTPLRWEEVESAVERRHVRALVSTPQEMIERVQRHGDLHEPAATLAQSLP